jgi:methyltransferase (TIGR00027 family)
VDEATPSSTAQGVALVRAVLTEKGLLDDPFAADLLDDRNLRRLRLLQRWPFRRLARGRSFAWLVARIRCFDDLVVGALDDGVRQVVVLAAGYDARAWRFARPDVRYWEVDHPATQADKRRRAPEGGPIYVPLDLAERPAGPALLDAGLDPDVATLFVAEGFAMYLDDDDLRAFVAGLAVAAGPGSRLTFNIGVGFDGGSGIIRRVGRRLLARRREPIRSTITSDTVSDLLTGTGWTVTQIVCGPELGRRHLDGTGLAPDDLNPGSAVVSAERNEGATPR